MARNVGGRLQQLVGSGAIGANREARGQQLDQLVVLVTHRKLEHPGQRASGRRIAV